jgi:hypothetical protein
MKNKFLAFTTLTFGVVSLYAPLLAHHGAAAYDMTKPVVMKNATVTKYLWANPHALVYFDVKDENGNVTHWSSEIGSPAAVGLLGWNRTSLKPGDVVTIYVFTAKNGNHVGRLNKLIFADGRMLRDTQVGGDKGERSDDDVR